MEKQIKEVHKVTMTEGLRAIVKAQTLVFFVAVS